jgi:predicted small secreted protein
VTLVEPSQCRAHLPVARAQQVAIGARVEIIRRNIMVRKVLAIFAISSSLVLAACNTVEGVGEDVQSAGEAVEDAAD